MTPLIEGGAAAIALVAAAGAWWWRARSHARGRIDDAGEAAGVAGETLPDFIPAGAVVGVDGAVALVVGSGARVAAVARRGRRLVVRELGWPALRSTGEGILVDTGDRALGTLLLAGVDVLDVRRLLPPA